MKFSIPTGMLEFNSRLNSTATQSVTVINLSNKEIAHNRIIEDSSNFHIDTTSILIPPRQLVDFVASCFLRTHNTETENTY